MMKQIDLTCKVAAPAVAGFIIAAFDSSSEDQQQGSDLTGAAILAGGVNVAALIVEYVCTARIYALVPTLALRNEPLKRNEMEDNSKKQGCKIWELPKGFETYIKQPVSMAGLGLSLL